MGSVYIATTYGGGYCIAFRGMNTASLRGGLAAPHRTRFKGER